ncbi:RidA family protein [Burkholderiaceae bacterium FT117]|uniref:RidA family protein n=1 Tax=Zeimonas sediminis TaxID=2944268 RepID=UPI0023430B6C|nr:RidA family protein [Zeimonas sediminis]MCM5570469.1 RidA family protein [Zeimonas sediminis]
MDSFLRRSGLRGRSWPAGARWQHRPFGRVGAEVTADETNRAAQLATMSMLGSLSRELGDLDRIVAWLRVDGFVLAAPGFDRTTNVINGCSDLIIEIFGPERGRHARAAMGVSATPLSCPVILAAEVAIKRV